MLLSGDRRKCKKHKVIALQLFASVVCVYRVNTGKIWTKCLESLLHGFMRGTRAPYIRTAGSRRERVQFVKLSGTQHVLVARLEIITGAHKACAGNASSRSYVEDVTSVTSGASQGPHSFNLVFVCLFVSRLALSRICPVLYRTSKDSWPQYFCLFVPSTCLALSRTCPVPSRVRYHQENE